MSSVSVSNPYYNDIIHLSVHVSTVCLTAISKIIRGDVDGLMSHLWVLDLSWQTRLVVAEMLRCELPPHARFPTEVVVDIRYVSTFIRSIIDVCPLDNRDPR